MDYQELLQKVEEQVAVFYRDHSDADLFYHNQSLTNEVLATTKRMADHYRLDDRSFFIVCAAASFLYAGFHQTHEKMYENKSAELAEIFLQLKAVDNETVAEIKNCILAKGLPQKPATLLEKILCDANTYYFGTNSFRDKMKLLKKEEEALGAAKIDGNTWRNTQISMLESHSYHTDFCKLLLDQTKSGNLMALQNRREQKIIKAKAAAEKEALVKAVPLVDTTDQEEAVIEQKKKIKAVRGSETMFRINSANSIRISVMADNKAHIMITVNSIILSVTLGMVVKNLDENRYLLIPALILLIVSVTTIIYAILATRPKILQGRFTREQLENKSVNLLFFGSFYNMTFEEYEEGIQAMMTDQQFLYTSLTKDIYWQGKVLGRKYRLLNICYTVFMYGIIVAVLAFAIAAIFFK